MSQRGRTRGIGTLGARDVSPFTLKKPCVSFGMAPRKYAQNQKTCENRQAAVDGDDLFLITFHNVSFDAFTFSYAGIRTMLFRPFRWFSYLFNSTGGGRQKQEPAPDQTGSPHG
jgi:hypothetical protein